MVGCGAMEYVAKQARLTAEIQRARAGVRIAKDTSNLFRERADVPERVNVKDFNTVLEVNVREGWVNAEGMASYERILYETLRHGVMPAVVPELKSITIGGAVSGTGLESSSFRFGFVHETVLEMDVLLPDGRIVTATPTNEFRDLFFGMPNSYGTLGYIVRVKAQTVPVKQYVQLTHRRFEKSEDFLAAMREACERNENDFVEGVIFSKRMHVLTTTSFCDRAPYTSDYTYMRIYYQSLLARSEDYLTVQDYIWRFDTDWFWRSDLFLAQNPVIRFLLGRKRLNSLFYTRIFRLNNRFRLTERIYRRFGVRKERIVQDVEIPIENAPAFLDFLHREIGIVPIMIGPVAGSPSGATRFTLFPLAPRLYVNIGCYGIQKTEQGGPYFNRRLEEKVRELDGIKMLYSDSYYTKEEFWKIYSKTVYDALKKKYDPDGKLRDLYEKCVLKA